MPQFEFKNKHFTPAGTAKLLANKGAWNGDRVDWGSASAPEQSTTLSAAEVAALNAKHGSKNVNLGRAERVKEMMQQGHKQARIIQRLRSLGRGYGERMIKADHAALSAVKKQ